MVKGKFKTLTKETPRTKTKTSQTKTKSSKILESRSKTKFYDKFGRMRRYVSYRWCSSSQIETRLSTRMKSRNSINKYTSKNIDKCISIFNDKSYTRPASRTFNEYIKYFTDLRPHLYSLVEKYSGDGLNKCKDKKTGKSKSEDKKIGKAKINDESKNNTNKNKRQINVLDSGAGCGRALDTMIRSSIIGPYVDIATGISMHNFPGIPDLLNKYNGSSSPSKYNGSLSPSRESNSNLEWYSNKSQNVLPFIESNRYDLITDLWGAYHYSVDRALLVEHYYRILKPGGVAFVMCSDNTFVLESSGTRGIKSQVHPKEVKNEAHPKGVKNKKTSSKSSKTNKVENKVTVAIVESKRNSKTVSNKRNRTTGTIDGKSDSKVNNSKVSKVKSIKTSEKKVNEIKRTSEKSFFNLLTSRYPKIFTCHIGSDNYRYLKISKRNTYDLKLPYKTVNYGLVTEYMHGYGMINFPYKVVLKLEEQKDYKS